MGRPLQTAWNMVPGPLTVPPATETALITTPSAPTPLEVNHVHVHFAFVYANGAAGSFFSYKIYRGSSANSPLAHAAPQLALSYTTADNAHADFDFSEDVVGMDNVQYTITFTATTGTTTMNDVFARVDVS